MAQRNSAIDTDNRNYLQLAANNIILHLHPSRVSAASLRFTYTWGLGGIAATLTLMLMMTGILLMFRYEPTVGQAYTSIKTLETEVMFGALVRAIHHWSANLLLIVACLHLARVFLTGGFKRGRTSTWVSGMGLLLLVVVFNFTGYLLPWDQLAYWAVTVSASGSNPVEISAGQCGARAGRSSQYSSATTSNGTISSARNAPRNAAHRPFLELK